MLLTCRFSYQLLIQMHHSMFWIIQFWICYTTWYSLNLVMVVAQVVCDCVAVFEFGIWTSVPLMPAGWDPAFCFSPLHPAQAASQEDIGPTSPYPIAIDHSCLLNYSSPAQDGFPCLIHWLWVSGAGKEFRHIILRWHRTPMVCSCFVHYEASSSLPKGTESLLISLLISAECVTCRIGSFMPFACLLCQCLWKEKLLLFSGARCRFFFRSFQCLVVLMSSDGNDILVSSPFFLSEHFLRSCCNVRALF